MQACVFGPIDDAHPAATHFLNNAVVRNGLADHAQECYGGRIDKSMKARALGAFQRDCWRKNRHYTQPGGVLSVIAPDYNNNPAADGFKQCLI